MSVYGLGAGQELGQKAHHGLYDLANQIVVVPSRGVPADVVVDHEITHINLVTNTSIGLLEQAFAVVKHAALAAGAADAAGHIDTRFSRPLQQACDLTHEAVAWFGTELHTRDRERMVAPSPYRRMVERFHALFRDTGLPPFHADADEDPGQVDILEEAAILALNSPVAGRIHGGLGHAIDRPLDRMLARARTDHPLWRFRAVVEWLEGSPMTDVIAWYRSREQRRDDLAGARPTVRRWAFGRPWALGRRQPLPEVRRSALSRAVTGQLLAKAAEASGLVNRPPFDDPAFSWDDYWSTASLLETFLPRIDRYAQICVVEPSWSDTPVVTGPEPDAAQTAALCIAGTVPPGDYRRFVQVRGQHGWGHVIFRGGSAEPLAWVAPAGDLRPTLLRARERGAAIVASSSDYRLADGDYPTCPMLAGVPHAVMAVLDFRALWIRLAFQEGGLAGSTTLEWSALASPGFGDPYGYLLVKPADQPSPVVILPTAGPARRLLTAAEALGSPSGVTLDQARSGHQSWLGSMAHHVTAAVSTFERWGGAA